MFSSYMFPNNILLRGVVSSFTILVGAGNRICQSLDSGKGEQSLPCTVLSADFSNMLVQGCVCSLLQLPFCSPNSFPTPIYCWAWSCNCPAPMVKHDRDAPTVAKTLRWGWRGKRRRQGAFSYLLNSWHLGLVLHLPLPLPPVRLLVFCHTWEYFLPPVALYNSLLKAFKAIWNVSSDMSPSWADKII